MNIRKIASLTAFISFILEIITSIILYIVPHGRVAYWSDWHLWGLSKTQWGNLHVNWGVLLILAILVHAYLNWSLIVKYLKKRPEQNNIFSANLNISLMITLAFTIGTYLNITPFSSILTFSESIKDKAAVTYGEPPYGHAELSSLKVLCKRVDLDPDKSSEKLRTVGIIVTNINQTILEIAKANKLSPKDVYMVIAPVQKSSPGKKALPPSPSGGFGKKPLEEICVEYDLDCQKIMKKLAETNLAASIKMSFKDIGEKYQRNPHDIYDLLKDSATTATTGQ